MLIERVQKGPVFAGHRNSINDIPAVQLEVSLIYDASHRCSHERTTAACAERLSQRGRCGQPATSQDGEVTLLNQIQEAPKMIMIGFGDAQTPSV
jgi:hypothetical protein